MMTGQRPWQGTALGVINIIGCVGAFLVAILLLFMQNFLSSFGEVTFESGVAVGGIMAMLGSLGLVAGIIALGIGVLAIFLARGAFKGQKWTVIVSLIFAALGALSALTSIDHGSNLVSLAINAFAGYCAIMCLKNSYYK